VRSEFDVLVVGAGPGGSNAAAAALKRGLSVAQIDAERFPRVKPCAGGLTAKAWQALEFELAPALRREFDSFEFNAWRGGKNVFTTRSRVLAMVVRPEFDNHAVEENRRRAGFAFFDGERVRSIEWDRERFELTTEERTLTGRALVGADGAYSLVNRTFALARIRGHAIAVEVNLRCDALAADPAPRPCFDFGALAQGYGWVFPKDDQISVGLYTLARPAKELRALLERYIEAKGLRPRGDALESFEAHRIPLGGYELRVPQMPVFLVGDAGGFADALTGEGIYHALESGRLAGEHAARTVRGEDVRRAYVRALWKGVLCDTWLTWKLAGAFYRSPERWLRLLGSPLVWRPLVHGAGAGATFSRSLARGGSYFVRSWLAGSASRA
jgi:geranylgeranyl reductase family protein